MKIELRRLADIKPYENNPRINDAAVDAVVNSLREFGFRQPIVLSEEDTGPAGTSGNIEWELEYAALQRALLNVQGAGNELRVFLRLRR